MKTPHQQAVASGVGPIFNPWIHRVLTIILLALWLWVTWAYF